MKNVGKNTIITVSIITAAVILIAVGFRAELFSNIAMADTNGNTCEYHGISTDLCTRCNPELIPEFKDRGDWCAGHNLPESQCDICAGGHAHGAEKSADEHDHEVEHGDDDDHDIDLHSTEMGIEHESEISVFFPENALHCETDEAIIQLASIKTPERTGMTIQKVVAVQSSPIIEAPAEILFDESNTIVLSTTIPALVTQWRVEPGQMVKKGEVLAHLNSPELPQMKAGYLEAHASWQLAKNRFDRQKELHKKDLISASEFDDSMTEFNVADAVLTGRAGMLKSAGLSDSDLKVIIKDKIINQTLNIYAPEDGIIIDRIAVLGELLEEGQPLAIIGNPESLWIRAHVRESDIGKVRLGDEMEFTADGNGFKRCSGEIIWIARFLDEETRTVTVRAKIKNKSDRIHAGEFGRASIRNSIAGEMVVIPKDAVQWEGCCNVVFVKETIDRFKPRKVKIEPGSNGYYSVSEGLVPGEEIVVNGSYLLKTELRKGSIGAGCAGH